MLIVAAMMVIVAFNDWNYYPGHCYYDLCSYSALYSSSSRVQQPMVDLPFLAPALLWGIPVPLSQLLLPEVQQTVASAA